MYGLAQTLYIKQTKIPYPVSKYKLHHHLNWPFLERLIETNCLAYIDFLLAETLLSEIPQASEALAAFICHLSVAARHGHLCIRIQENEVKPDPAVLWSSGTETKLAANDIEMLTSLILKGAAELPADLASICRHQNLYYLQRYWVYETQILQHYQDWLKQAPDINLDNMFIQSSVKTLTDSGQLLTEQADAIIKACQSNLTIICGGPGTGKTYTAGHIIRLFWQALPPEARKNCIIALAAPTGKAAANLQKSLTKSVSDLQDFNAITAKTLHALLGINNRKRKYEEEQPPALNADLLIVDESSMIDAKMMATLFAALKPGSRLVLLGDPHQLPSVEAGSIFADLINLQKNSCMMLKKCLRAELKEIVDFAAAVNAGDVAETMALLNRADAKGITRVEFSGAKPADLQQAILDYASASFMSAVPANSSDEEILNLFNRFRMLSPLRQGPFGVNEINSKLYQKLVKQAKKQPCFAAPIMLTSHDHRLGLFNGEVGVLVRHSHTSDHVSDHFQKGDFALFATRQGQILRIPALLLPRFEFAYCLSVHKSQGSEFNRVFLLLPEGSENFGREVFYTAATRAKQKLEVWGSDAVISQTVAAQSLRLSGLCKRTERT